MDIHQFRVFLSVFRNRSFTKASEELHLSQPTVSDHVRSLEDELGCVFFDRLGRTIKPTKEAEVLFIHASEIVERITHLREAVGSMKKEISGELVIGASTIPGTYILPGILASFRKLHHLVSFEIPISDTGGIIEKLGIHLAPPIPNSHVSKKIHDEPHLHMFLNSVLSLSILPIKA